MAINTQKFRTHKKGKQKTSTIEAVQWNENANEIEDEIEWNDEHSYRR